MSLHIDDLIISGTPAFLTWFLKKIKEHFTVGHEDKIDLTFTGQRVRWVLDAQDNKKYISIDQKLCVSELEEIVIPKHLKDTDVCVTNLSTPPIDPCWVASTGCSHEFNFRRATSCQFSRFFTIGFSICGSHLWPLQGVEQVVSTNSQ